jgi:hypothetical protein
MPETPKTRDELIDLAVECKFSRADVSDFVGCIEAHGLRIVPAEPTEEMAKAGYETSCGPYEFCSERGKAALTDELRAAIAASPFAPAQQKVEAND